MFLNMRIRKELKMAVLDRGLKGVALSKVQEQTGLVGSKMKCTVTREAGEGYPFAQYDAPVPVKVIGEYQKFIVCEVLPHIANTTQIFGESKPYRITISKFDLMKGAVKLTPM